MDKVLRYTLFLGGIISTVLSAATIDNPLMASQYLMHFNYIKQSDMDQGVPMSEDILVAGIRRFQNFANLTVTGEFDNATMDKMNQPRCGVGDMMFNIDAARKRRFAVRKPWPMTTLTWRIVNFTPDFGTPAIITKIMRDSFDFWADASGLTFNQVPANDPSADIVISFAPFSHGDGYPFDGPGGTLAHAYFPSSNRIGGDAHFDESETFAAAGGGVNLLQVAVHEFGHSLGLGHSEVDAAVMAPFYTGYDPNFALHPDDIAGIQTLYGPNVGSPDIPMRPEVMPSDVPCTGQFDTITRTSDGGTYAFKGNMVFKLDNKAIGLESGFPTEISSVFAGLPNDLDASVFFEDVGKTYFFKGSQYYRFSGTTLDRGYPRSISKWNGLPNHLDAGFMWSGNGRVYFIKGNQYYRYNRYSGAVDAGYPRPLRVWRGLPASVESAMQWSNSRTYFFSDEEYYRFNDRSFRVDTSYPRSTVRYWIGCKLDDLQQATTPTSGSNTYMSRLAVIIMSSLISLQLVK